jgi:hypothetical protein
MVIGTTHILQAKFQRLAKEIEGLGMKNHHKEKGLGADPTTTSQRLVKDARSLNHSNFHKSKGLGANPTLSA